MRRTLNEVRRICQKAAEGVGAPAGVDVDVAEGAVWLAARGLDPLASLASELEGLAAAAGGSGCGGIAGIDDPYTLDASGQGGALVAPGLVDLLVARAVADGRTGLLQATGVSVPLFLLPAAAGYAEDGWHFRFALTGPNGERFLLVVSPGQGPSIKGSAKVESAGAALSTTKGFDLDAAGARRAKDLPESGEDGPAILADPGALEEAASRSVVEGLEVAPALWARLQALATEVLVPATEESRRRGAGELGGADT